MKNIRLTIGLTAWMLTMLLGCSSETTHAPTATQPKGRLGNQTAANITPQMLLEAAKKGGDYLASAVDDNGKYLYQYDPLTGSALDDYNMPRHLGATWALLEIYRETKDKKYLEPAKRAIGYMVKHVQSIKVGGQTALALPDSGKDMIQLTTNSLAVVMLAEYTRMTDDEQYLPIMQGLMRWAILTWKVEGYGTHYQTFSTGKFLDRSSAYAPGQAVFALCRLYQIDQDKQWLDGASRMSFWIIGERDKNLATNQLPHDHWFCYALNDLNRLRNKSILVHQAMRMSSTMVKSQIEQPDNLAYDGAWTVHDGEVPRTTPCSVRTEALTATYYLARDYVNQQTADYILVSAKKAAAFQLRHQFLADYQTKGFKYPARCTGGMPGSSVDLNIRIDYVQHHMAGILHLRNIMLEK